MIWARFSDALMRMSPAAPLTRPALASRIAPPSISMCLPRIVMLPLGPASQTVLRVYDPSMMTVPASIVMFRPGTKMSSSTLIVWSVLWPTSRLRLRFWTA